MGRRTYPGSRSLPTRRRSFQCRSVDASAAALGARRVPAAGRRGPCLQRRLARERARPPANGLDREARRRLRRFACSRSTAFIRALANGNDALRKKRIVERDVLSPASFNPKPKTNQAIRRHHVPPRRANYVDGVQVAPSKPHSVGVHAIAGTQRAREPKAVQGHPFRRQTVETSN